jgi:aminopeptidase
VLRGGAFALGAGLLGGGLAGCGSGFGGVPGITPIEAADSSLDPYFAGHGAGGFLVNRYALTLEYVPADDRLSGTAEIRIQPSALLSGVSFDCTGPTVSAVTVNGVRSAFTQNAASGKVHIAPPSPMNAGQLATIVMTYSVHPSTVAVPGIGRAGWFTLASGVAKEDADPDAAEAGGVGVGSGGAVTSAVGAAAVVGLPIGASTWFPCADHPTLKAPYEIALTVPNGLSVLANGRLVGSGPTPAGSGKTLWHYRHDEPMATYLATVQVGNFRLDTRTGPGGVQIRDGYPADIASDAYFDLGRQGQMLSTFAELYGAYPFDVFGTCVRDGLPITQFGAQTLGLLASDQIDGKRTHELDVAAGLAQQWFGASNSIAAWSDYWLTSGTSLHAAWVWAEQSGGPSAQVSAQAAMAQLGTLPQDVVPANPGATRLTAPQVELRAACYLQTLRTTMGDGAFFGLLRQWAANGVGGYQGYDEWIQLLPNVYPGIGDDAVTQDWLLNPKLPQLS